MNTANISSELKLEFVLLHIQTLLALPYPTPYTYMHIFTILSLPSYLLSSSRSIIISRTNPPTRKKENHPSKSTQANQKKTTFFSSNSSSFPNTTERNSQIFRMRIWLRYWYDESFLSAFFFFFGGGCGLLSLFRVSCFAILRFQERRKGWSEKSYFFLQLTLYLLSIFPANGVSSRGYDEQPLFLPFLPFLILDENSLLPLFFPPKFIIASKQATLTKRIMN